MPLFKLGSIKTDNQNNNLKEENDIEHHFLEIIDNKIDNVLRFFEEKDKRDKKAGVKVIFYLGLSFIIILSIILIGVFILTYRGILESSNLTLLIGVILGYSASILKKLI